MRALHIPPLPSLPTVPASARAALRLNQMAARAAFNAALRPGAQPPRRPTARSYDPLVALIAGSVPTLADSAAPLRSLLDALAELSPAHAIQPHAVEIAGVPAFWIDPPAAPGSGASPACTLLYFHGGGYVCGSPHTHLRLMAHLSTAAHARVLAPAYRLAPEHPYPAAVEDAWAVYWWLLAQGTPPASIFVAGDSAGGGLSVALMLALRDAGLPLPRAALLLSPWLDLACRGLSLHANAPADYLNEVWLRAAAAMYLHEADPRTPLASPLYADLRGLSPMLIQVGTAEMLLDDALRFAQRAVQAGVPVELELWENMVHVWQFLDRVEPKARQAINRAGRFVRDLTSG